MNCSNPVSNQTAAQPLSAAEMVPNTVLRELAQGDPQRQMGELSAEHQAMLSMYLPEICGELLAYRAAAAASTPPPVQRRGSILQYLLPPRLATDGTRDDPFNGQLPAPGTSPQAQANG